MANRRSVLQTIGLVAAAGFVPLLARPGRAAGNPEGRASNEPLAAALADSDTVYLTPLKPDGAESTCQAEVWFVTDGADLCIVTAAGAWRARAVKSGLTRARLWVGELGVWTKTEGRYRDLPGFDATGARITGADEQARILELFGAKYPVSWVLWGPRFRNGLADGSRVMLRYTPATG